MSQNYSTMSIIIPPQASIPPQVGEYGYHDYRLAKLFREDVDRGYRYLWPSMMKPKSPHWIIQTDGIKAKLTVNHPEKIKYATEGAGEGGERGGRKPLVRCLWPQRSSALRATSTVGR